MRFSDDFEVPIEVFLKEGKRVVVLGKSGSGKTNFLFLVLEEWLKAGLPMVVIDVEGDFADANIGVFTASAREGADFPLTADNAGRLAEVIYEHRLSAIIDTSDHPIAQQETIWAQFLSAFWNKVLLSKSNPPFGLMIDEAKLFIPQGKKTEVSPIMNDMAARCRKRNMTLFAATQRTQYIDKDTLTQASMFVTHRVMTKHDVTVVNDLLPNDMRRDALRRMRKFLPGEAYVFGDPEFIGYENEVIQMRARYSQMGQGDTENPIELVTAGKVDDDLREVLKGIVDSGDIPEADETDRLRAQVESLEQALADAQQESYEQAEAYEAQIGELVTAHAAEVAGLKQQIEMLSKLTVTGEGSAPQVADVETINAGRLVVGQNGHHPVQGVLQLPEGNGALALEREKNRQDKQFKALLRDIKDMPKAYQRVIGYLTEKEGHKLTNAEIARALDISPATVRYKPLEELGVVASGRQGRVKVYWSKVGQMADEKFAHLPKADVVDGVLAAVPV